MTPQKPRQLREEIPAIYEGLLPKEFLEQNSSEALATCNDCRMCKPQFAPPPDGTYTPDTKCCTFYPFVPNYLVGGALENGGEGADRIRKLIRERQWTLPIGIVAPPSYQVRFNDKRPEEFGRNHTFLCPFYDGGKCGIWRFRNGDCSTYFCAHEEGEEGRMKWFGIGAQLFSSEMILTQECMLEKGFDWEEVENTLRFIKFTVHKNDQAGEFANYEMSAMQWNGFWQHRADDVEAYYRECFAWVSTQKSLRTTLAPIFATNEYK